MRQTIVVNDEIFQYPCAKASIAAFQYVREKYGTGCFIVNLGVYTDGNARFQAYQKNKNGKRLDKLRLLGKPYR